MENKDKPAYPEWISVKEQTPKADGIYLGWDNGYCEVHFKNGKWMDIQATEKSTSPYLRSRFRRELNITYWTLLPPPKTESPTINE